MIFQRKIDRAYQKLHEESDHPEEPQFENPRSRKRRPKGEPQDPGDLMKSEPPELEKNDFLAMVLAALITIVPVAAIVLVVITLIGYFFFIH